MENKNKRFESTMSLRKILVFLVILAIALPVTGTASADAPPSLVMTTTTSNITLPSSGTVTLSANVTFTGGTAPTGWIETTLTTPSGLLTAPLYVSGNKSITVSTTLPTTGRIAGTYIWTASFTDDVISDNNTSSNQVQTIVNAAPTTLATGTATTTSATIGSFDTLLRSSVDLTGGYYPTGTITFSLSAPGGATVDTETVTVNGNGTYTTPTGFTLTPSEAVTGTYTWNVTYSGDSNNIASTSSSDCSVTVTPQQADLSITNTVSNATPNVGDTIAFTITATNNGPDSATGVVVTDLLPAGLTFVAATPSQGTYSSIIGTWSIGAVSVASPVSLMLQARVVSLDAQTNTATISHADQTDPDTTNNSASVTVTSTAPTYTVTFDSQGGSPVSNISGVTSGSTIIAPAAPTLSGYTFIGWYKEASYTNAWTYNVDTVTDNLTLFAKWKYNGGGGGGGGGSSSGSNGSSSSSSSNPPITSTYYADISGTGLSGTTLPIITNTEAGSAAVDLRALGESMPIEEETIIITIPSIPGVNAFTLGIPVDYLSAPDRKRVLVLNTNTGSITLPAGMLANIRGLEGQKAEITISQGDKSGMPDSVKTAIGERPLIQLTVSIGGKQIEWNNPNAPVMISIPYTPKADELAYPESIVIWYIDGDGKAVSIPNGRYNPVTESVSFAATHFSNYAVSYNLVSFKDVAAGTWYGKAVSFIAAREITTGTSDGNYNPDTNLNRGEFLVMLMKSYGIAADTNPTDNFSDAGSTYYTGYLAAAKRLGISSGAGNNSFTPEKDITRQEMFTLLYNALKVIGKLPQGNTDKTLSDFTDASLIDSWAQEAMTLLVETGSIGGSAGKLTPTGTTTRAEMAQVLYNLLAK
ncbi:S-layer homology domain-containing protein [Paenibacillus taichungensis]|uniref:S-layer homology domain-containing protein n=1 Tax=Paenibacillus taichungensis TaxID=484184 RepID=UPI0038D190C3